MLIFKAKYRKATETGCACTHSSLVIQSIEGAMNAYCHEGSFIKCAKFSKKLTFTPHTYTYVCMLGSQKC